MMGSRSLQSRHEAKDMRVYAPASAERYVPIRSAKHLLCWRCVLVRMLSCNVQDDADSLYAGHALQQDDREMAPCALTVVVQM